MLPLLLLRDFTPANELRYLSIADEALLRHTFFTFSNHGVPYADKPPLYLWIVMLCRWLTGEHRMWLLALFSLLPAVGIVRTMDRWCRQEMDSEGRTLAQWLLWSCVFFVGLAVTLRMDMLMTLFIVLSLRAFWRMVKQEEHPGRARWQFPLFLFLAVFTKGPLGLLVPLCSTTAFLLLTRRMREFSRYWGWRTWGVLLAGCALWFGAVWLEGGSGYLYDLLFRQTAGRAVRSFHHAEPFYYYVVCIWYLLAPWSLLVIGAVAASLRPASVRSELQCFFLCVGITTFVLLSCISAKLEIYLLPALPFLVYAAVIYLSRFGESGWVRFSLTVPAVVWSTALPAVAVMKMMMPTVVPDCGWVDVAALLLTVSGLRSLYLLYGSRPSVQLAGTVRCMGTGLLLALFAGSWALPEINATVGYGTLCRQALELSQDKGIADFRTWQLSRAENLDVYLHRPVTVLSGEEVPASDGTPFLLLTRTRCLPLFPGHESRTVGPYAVVVCKNKNNPENFDNDE